MTRTGKVVPAGTESTPPIYSPDYWRKRAAEARAIADQLTDANAQRVMRTIAENYDKMVKTAEQLEKSRAALGRQTRPR